MKSTDHCNISKFFLKLSDTKMVHGKNIADFKSLINLALNNRIPWSPLKTFLDDLTSTLEASKELNVILFDELQLLHAK